MNTWHGLRTAFLARAAALGYPNLTAFAEDNWNDGWIALWEKLGVKAGNPMDLYELLLGEAIEAQAVPRFVRGALVRNFAWKLPDGWGNDDLAGARRAWSLWCGKFEDWAAEPGLSVFRILERQHPPGWRPRDPDDPVLVDAFREAGFPYEQVRSNLH